MTRTEIQRKYKNFINNYNIKKKSSFWAFVFGPFYFLKHRQVDLFFMFLLLPIVILPALILMKLFTDSIITFLGAAAMLKTASFGTSFWHFFALTIIANHFIIYLVSGNLIYKRLKKYIKDSKSRQPANRIIYFSISITRLVVLSIFTFGLYHVYWMYKNWKAVKIYNDKEVVPVLRSWFFGIFFVYRLLKKMNLSFKRKFPAISYGIIIITCLFFDALLSHPDDASVLVSLPFTIIITLVLIPIQKRINEHNKKINRLAKPAKKLYLGEVLIIIFSLCVFYPLLFLQPLIKEQRDQMISDVNPIVIATYTQTVAVPEVCKKHGYDMKLYPNEFLEEYKEELNSVDDYLSDIDTTVRELVRKMDNDYKLEINDNIEKELEYIRQSLIKQLSKEDKSMKIKYEYMEKEVSIKYICEKMEESPTDFFEIYELDGVFGRD